MKYVRAIYASVMAKDIDDADILDILTVSRANNAKCDITGLMCFGSRKFIQCIEGPRDGVNETYSKIIKDNRHEKIVMLSYTDTDFREFETWDMGYVPESSLTKELLEQRMGRAAFDPYALDSTSALHFLQQAKQQVPLV